MVSFLFLLGHALNGTRSTHLWFTRPSRKAEDSQGALFSTQTCSIQVNISPGILQPERRACFWSQKSMVWQELFQSAWILQFWLRALIPIGISIPELVVVRTAGDVDWDERNISLLSKFNMLSTHRRILHVVSAMQPVKIMMRLGLGSTLSHPKASCRN